MHVTRIRNTSVGLLSYSRVNWYIFVNYVDAFNNDTQFRLLQSNNINRWRDTIYID